MPDNSGRALTYDETRDAEQLRILDVAICEFILRYNSKARSASRRTMIFFPGGLASQLIQAWDAYFDDSETPQAFNYQPLWINPISFVAGDRTLNALALQMRKDDRGGYRDSGDKIVVANGSVVFLGLAPYDLFLDWCDDNNIDWFVFGWDWRRRLDEVAQFFLKKFLPRFRSRVMDFCDGADPLERFSLVGHSFGGMVVNLILRETETDPFFSVHMRRAVTVATPFYGYAGQVHHWFDLSSGFENLKKLGRKNVLEVITSLPAVYALNWLDVDIFEKYGPLLAANPKYPLRGYPSTDATDPSQPADPYDPRTNGVLTRYPATTGFDMEELRHGRDVSRKLVEPLSGNLARKFYNIRGIEFHDGEVWNQTVNNTSWGWISQDWDADTGASPINDAPLGPGDSVLPAWSTHLALLPESNRIDVELGSLGDQLDHMFMMAAPAVWDSLAEVLEVVPAAQPKRQRSPPLPEPASTDEAAAYVHGLQGLRDKDMAKHHDRYTQGQLRSIARRILMDLLK